MPKNEQNTKSEAAFAIGSYPTEKAVLHDWKSDLISINLSVIPPTVSITVIIC